jgi:hypothetical protein
MMQLDDVRRQNLIPYKPGQSGNPHGKPPGTKQAFSKAFMRDLAVVWDEHGAASLRKTAMTQPAVFAGICARLIPQNVEVTLQEQRAGFDDTDIAILRAIRDSIPEVNTKSPTEVLQYVQARLAAPAT